MFDEISMIELILHVTSFELIGLDLIFKLETYPSFMCYFFQAFSGFKNSQEPQSGYGWNRRDLQTSNFR